MLRPTVSLSLVLGLGLLAGGGWAPRAAHAAPDQAEDPVADWKQRWDKTLKDAAGEYGKIAKKYTEKLEASAAGTRWRILRYLPDDPAAREFLGYTKAKQADGTEKWERVDTVRDKLNELSDLEDPKATKFAKEVMDAEKKIANWFKGLAKKAIENAAAKGASPEAGWAEKSRLAWERVIEVEDQNDEARKALGHEKFESKYCSPYKLPFAKARSARKTAGEKTRALTIKPVDEVPPDGSFVAAGLTGGGAKSAHVVINATHGKDLSAKLAVACEKSLIDVIAVYGYPEQVAERLRMKKLSFVKTPEEYRQFLEKGANEKPAEVTRLIEAHLMGTGVNGGSEYVKVSQTEGNTEHNDAVDGCINIFARFASVAAAEFAAADLGGATITSIEDWLWQSISYDVTRRVNNSAITVWGTIGRYGQNVEARPGEDKWISLARLQVETDDDVPLKELPRKKLDNQDIHGPETVKGFAFIQFLFESDAENAKKFIWNAIVKGTPQAVAAVYPDNAEAPDPEKSMAKLDEEYRKWIVKAW